MGVQLALLFFFFFSTGTRLNYLLKVGHILHGNALLFLYGKLHSLLYLIYQGLEGRGGHLELYRNICPEHSWGKGVFFFKSLDWKDRQWVCFLALGWFRNKLSKCGNQKVIYLTREPLHGRQRKSQSLGGDRQESACLAQPSACSGRWCSPWKCLYP